ncbi:hypothetical protein OQA88_5049 [Cercophora sp. LCS_1]
MGSNDQQEMPGLWPEDSFLYDHFDHFSFPEFFQGSVQDHMEELSLVAVANNLVPGCSVASPACHPVEAQQTTAIIDPTPIAQWPSQSGNAGAASQQQLMLGSPGPSVIPNHPAAMPGPETPQCDSPLAPPPPRENLERDCAANKSLMTLRRAGWPYKDIAKELEKKYGLVATPNALAKRHKTLLLKSQEEYLEPLPGVIKNMMPGIMALIRSEAARVGLSDADMKSLDDLPEVIPTMVQSRILRKRKA